MNVRERINPLSRRLRPPGLVAEWQQVLAAIDERWGLATGGATVEALARKAAATGRHPGDVLASLLVERHRGGQGA